VLCASGKSRADPGAARCAENPIITSAVSVCIESNIVPIRGGIGTFGGFGDDASRLVEVARDAGLDQAQTRAARRPALAALFETAARARHQVRVLLAGTRARKQKAETLKAVE